LPSFEQGYIVVDEHAVVVDLSQRAATLLGLDRATAVGIPVAELIHPGDADVSVFEGAGSHLRRTIEDGSDWNSPLSGVVVREGGGTAVLNIQFRQLGTGGALVLIADAAPVRDILDAHDALVSVTSHELKTPLTAIKATAELLISYDVDKAQREEMMGDIYRQAERLEVLIREILDASQIDSGRVPLELAAVDLKDSVAEVLDELQTQTAEATLLVRIPKGLPKVWADAAKLRQILVNLITNAIKYSPQHASVVLRASAQDQAVRVEIKDRGIGIKAEDQTRLFKKFQRIPDPATRGTSGTGLGLYIVQGLVDLHGGTIDVTSTYGKGSVFAFTLPLAPARDRAGI
jgi:two-component system phosphate regulon sensor histidine kinase PhoR